MMDGYGFDLDTKADANRIIGLLKDVRLGIGFIFLALCVQNCGGCV